MISRVSLGFAFIAAMFAVPHPSHSEDVADLILVHGVFYPVQPAQPVKGSLAVRGGRIIYLGNDAGATALRGPATRLIDLSGRAVTPGLIDAHSHLAGLGEKLDQVDLNGAASYDEVIRRVRPAAGRPPPRAGLRRRGRLPLRAALLLTDDEALLARWFARGPEIDPAARVTVRGVKMYADGALGSRGAALLEPYSDDPGNLGLLVTPGAHLEAVARQAAAHGFQVAIHAIGDRGGLVALDAMERALGGPRPQLRFRLEHAQVLRLQDIDRLAKLGIVASMQPTHATSDMPWARDRLGA